MCSNSPGVFRSTAAGIAGTGSDTRQAMRNAQRVLRIRIEEFSADAQRQLVKAIKDAKKPQKRGNQHGNRNATLRKDRNDVISEIRRRRKKTKRPLTQIIREMRNGSAYSARMRSVSVSSWRAYYYRR